LIFVAVGKVLITVPYVRLPFGRGTVGAAATQPQWSRGPD